ncbi:MAG: DUF4437 domain-containing protein [Filomicrobium sp.]
MRVLKLPTLALLLASAVLVHMQVAAKGSEAQAEVVLRSELEFVPLNPARGDAAPQAGVLWGDIRKDVPSGVLLKFAPGFSSPPHIHNITYRAVVISGALYNGSENAEKMWMGPGSYWNQPAGAPHITAATKDSGATAFLEILEGPYLVQPTKLLFDNGERPVNLEAGNVVWLDASDVTWVDTDGASSGASGVTMAFLWGSPQAGKKNGTFLKLRPGFRGLLHSNDSQLRAVVIHGQVSHQLSGKPGVKELTPGSYFGSKGGIKHQVLCEAATDCVIYVRTEGKYQVVPE